MDMLVDEHPFYRRLSRDADARRNEYRAVYPTFGPCRLVRGELAGCVL